jgi:HSP20 family molecular chaperone IbpA
MMWHIDEYTPKEKLPSYVKDDTLFIDVEIPGIKRENLTVSTEKQRVQLSWKHTSRAGVDTSGSKTILVGKDWDLEKLSAKLTDGVLELTVPRSAVNRRVVAVT